MISDAMMHRLVDGIIKFDKWLSWELEYTQMTLPRYVKERLFFHFVLNPPWKKCTECSHSHKLHVFDPGEYRCEWRGTDVKDGKERTLYCNCGYNTGR